MSCGEKDDDSGSGGSYPDELVGTWECGTDNTVKFKIILKKDGTASYFIDGELQSDYNKWHVKEPNKFYFARANYNGVRDLGVYAVEGDTLSFSEGLGHYKSGTRYEAKNFKKQTEQK